MKRYLVADIGLSRIKKAGHFDAQSAEDAKKEAGKWWGIVTCWRFEVMAEEHLTGKADGQNDKAG